MNISYLFLTLGIIFEAIATTMLKLSQGFTRLVPAGLMVVCYGVSFLMLSLTLRKVEVSVAYAIWSGVGTALIAMIGILWFKEPLTAIKIGSIALIILGVIGLNLGGAVH